MKIALIGKNFIIKEQYTLDNNKDYYICNKSQKLINIKINNGVCEAVSSNYSKIINNELALQFLNNNLSIQQLNERAFQNIILEENSIYPVLINSLNEIYILCCFPDCEENFTHYDIITNKEITIGSNNNNSIVYKNLLVSAVHARIYKFNGIWTIENFNSDFGIFVNDFPVYNTTKNIFNGDVILIMGLKIVLIKDSLYINNPQNNIIINDNYFKLSNLEKELLDDKLSTSNENITLKNNNTDYFYRSPKMLPKIKVETVEIDDPPQPSDDDQQRPSLLTLGSSLAMGLMMVSSMGYTLNNLSDEDATTFDKVTGFLYSFTMLISMLIFPVLELRWEKHARKKYEEKRQKKYKKYLEKKNNLIKQLKENQKEVLYKNYLAVDECIKVISEKSPRLWERKIGDDDFLSIRIGVGDVPMAIDISYPQEKFEMVVDNLMTSLNEIKENARFIKNCPITISLAEKNIAAIVSADKEFTTKYLKNIILQLVTFHSYEDLKLVFLLDKKDSDEYEYVKNLPHVWDDTKTVRFFADNYNDMHELSKYLMEELNNRAEERNNTSDDDYTSFSPYYLIITDNYKLIDSLSFITAIQKQNKNLGFSLLCITDDIYSLPSSCSTFIDVRKTITGTLYENGVEEINQTEFNVEPLVTVFFEKISQTLSNIPIRQKKIGASSLPNSYTFLDMYNVGNIEQLNILNRWQENDSTLSLKAPIGVDSNGMLIYLDAHEKFHGPHGLIAGATGSGKSEFIITWILSLAINYHPDDLAFLLIDYKGGGLAGAFLNDRFELPHLVGTITNIEKSDLERSLVSIESELKRREIIFNEARNISSESTIDIYKYQKLYHDGIVNEPIPHLFIICDEFAELKQQEPDFMDQLVSVSRIGRSLGVHLILATQKPSGIVNDQIRSNSKFGICLKVQEPSDSQDVILTSDAAFLINPGQFYLKVGHNEYYVLGQSGWAGAPYYPSDEPLKKIDSSVEFISNIGLSIKKIDEAKQINYKNHGEQLTNILSYICKIAKDNNINNTNLWLDKLPANIYLKELKDKYDIQNNRNNNSISICIGEYDDPANQEQGLVELDFSRRDNIVIYGNAESGKETLLSTIIFDLMTSYSPEEAQVYILDFGTEALKIFIDSPHVGDVIFLGEDDKLRTFFDMIQEIIRDRKQILSDYNGDFNLYIKKGNVMPIITVILNNYEVFDENYERDYDDLFLTLTRDGTKCGIVFIVTASSANSMRYRLNSNFNNKIALMLNSDDDYYNIFEYVGRKRPTHIFGRGLISIQKAILEFQIAKICEANNYNEYIEETINALNEEYEVAAPPVPTLPEIVELQDVIPYMEDLSTVPLGISKQNLNIYTYDFMNNFMTVISSKNMNDAIVLQQYIFEELEELENTKVIILDVEASRGDKQGAYDNFIASIREDIENTDEVFTVCAIIGIDKFISDGIIDEYEFNQFLSELQENGKHSFIIVDNNKRLQDRAYDSWFTNYTDKSCGIWVGSGIEDQSLITLDYSFNNLENRCGNSFGYVVNNGIPTLIKYIGIEEDENNE